MWNTTQSIVYGHKRKKSKVDTIVISNKDEYHSDYCVIAAATKRLTTPRQPVLVADRDAGLRLSSPAADQAFSGFVKRHTGGNQSQVIIKFPTETFSVQLGAIVNDMS